MVETPLEKNSIQLTDELRLSFDPRNIILQEKFEKKTGRGAGAIGTGEYDYKDVSYYGTLKALGNALIHKEVIKSLSEVKGLEDVIEYVEKAKEELVNHLQTHITIDLGDYSSGRGKKKIVKGIEVSEEDVVSDGDID